MKEKVHEKVREVLNGTPDSDTAPEIKVKKITEISKTGKRKMEER